MFYKKMKFCPECGGPLQDQYLEGEGIEPFCPACREYRFPIMNTAVSMIVREEESGKIVLIRQYGKPYYVLVAGYVNQGEDAEHACARELMEEMGLEADSVHFNRSHYYEPHNTLMLNFTVSTHGKVRSNREVDSYQWFTPQEALQNIRQGSLAESFLKGYLTGIYEFH